MNSFNYLHLLSREVKGVLLYRGLPLPILSKLIEGEPVVKSNFLISRKSSYTILSSFEMKVCEFFPENFAESVVILHNYPMGTLSNLTSLGWRNHRSVVLVLTLPYKNIR